MCIFIFKSMQQGPSFRITTPKFPTKDPNHRIFASQKSRFTHDYFYIRALYGAFFVKGVPRVLSIFCAGPFYEPQQPLSSVQGRSGSCTFLKRPISLVRPPRRRLSLAPTAERLRRRAQKGSRMARSATP